MDEHDLYNQGRPPVDRSGWTKPQGLARAYPRLEARITADVVVVGAGLAGSSLALHLAEAGIRVAVLEARQPGWGASGRNAGHVLPVLRDIKVLSGFPDGGQRFLDIFREHHTIPFDLAAKHQIDCDAERSGYLNGMTSKRAFEAFLAQSAYLEKLSLQKVTPLTGADMVAATGSDHYRYGVLYENGGRINPYLFTNGMIAAAERLGAAVYGDSEVVSVEPGARWSVRTAAGEVLADRVVFCTAAYPTKVVPEFQTAFYPLTAYALTTNVLPPEGQAHILPGGATFAQVPLDLNPLVKDRHGRLVLSSIPRPGAAQDADWHFQQHLRWLWKIWPQTREMDIRLESYWTGRVAMRKKQFPGVFDLKRGLYGLMYFNAWGNVMAPLLGKLVAEGLVQDCMDALPFPVEKPEPVGFQGAQDLLIRRLLIPAARTGQRLGLLT